MNEEQIKQNAEQYANSLRLSTENPPSAYHIGIYDGYIEGAHSRDEEIKQLEAVNKILKKALEYNVDTYEKELDKLRNPWISVEERLPEKIKNKGVSKYAFVTWPDGTHGEAYYNYEEYKAPRWEIKGAGVSKPVQWMYIPK